MGTNLEDLIAISQVLTKSEALKYAQKSGIGKRTIAKNTGVSPANKVIATHYVKAYDGGVERVNAQLMKIWVGMGYRVILITEEPENSLDFSYPSSVVRYVIPKSEHIADRLTCLTDICAKESVDIFINHKWRSGSVLWEILALRLMGIPYIQHIHGIFNYSLASTKDNMLQPEVFSW